MPDEICTQVKEEMLSQINLRLIIKGPSKK